MIFTTREAAEYLHVNRHQVEAWVREGKLTVVKFPGLTRYRFAIEDLDAFILRSKVGPEVDPIEWTALEQNSPKLAPIDQGPRDRSQYQKGWQDRIRRVF